MAGPVTKLTISDTLVLNSKTAMRELLLAEGWTDDERTQNMAAAVTHLAWLYGADEHVSVAIEWNPSHYQITVDLR